ncbi:MAG: GNAT family N-acetyltransferase, partial [Dongiaceae bacterium]
PALCRAVGAAGLRLLGDRGEGLRPVRRRGRVGRFKRSIEPSFAGAPEIGWALAAWAHGAGFATEAVGAAVAWGDGHLGSERTVCLIGPDNLASIRVAEKCGYREYERTTYKDHPTILFQRQRRVTGTG